MPSKIESDILIPEGLMGVAGLSLMPNEVIIDLASWEKPIRRGRLSFTDSRFLSFCTTYLDTDFAGEPDQLEFPWDIIGFDSTQLDSGQWNFVLNSHVLEIAFEADWPNFSKL